MQPILADKAFPELVQWADELAALRRDIHAHPELGFETPRTVDLIVKTLKGWGLEHVDPDEVKGGVVVVINGAAPGATVALRADIDALPMPDNSANPWKSQTEMRCHACGHDGHAAFWGRCAICTKSARVSKAASSAFFSPLKKSAAGRSVLSSPAFLSIGAFRKSTVPMMNRRSPRDSTVCARAPLRRQPTSSTSR